jgi:drug/metabolite transporter (DMT)-like permease
MKRLSPAATGTLYCVLAPGAYASYNICLRGVSGEQDSAWITCVQASVGVAVFGAYLGWQAVQRRPALPPWKETLSLLAIGLITQLGGVAMVWAMGIVGVGTTATLQMGVMLAFTAILGRIVLGEPVSRRQMIAIGLIVIAVFSFSRGAQPVENVAVDQAAATVPSLLGIAAGVLSGLAFAVLVVGVRKAVTSETSPEATVFLISVMGVAFMGPLCVYRLGIGTLVHTPAKHFGVMLLGGAMNVIGFLLLTKALKVVSAIRVNVLNNALTMALTVIAGIVFFAEPWNGHLAFGIIVSIIGVIVISIASPSKANAT